MVRESLIWNNQSWGKPVPELKEAIPPVNKLKWLEPRHMVNLENRWARDRKDGLQYIFFNGVGYVAWENIWGIWNQFTERDGAALKRISAIYREFPELLVSLDWEPYAHTLQNGVFSSGFPGADCTLWTVVNRNEFDLDGEQLLVAHQDGTSYYDLWHGVPITPKLQGGRAILSLALETHGFGAVLAVRQWAVVEGLEEFLKTMANHASVPLQLLSEKWAPPQQTLVEIAPTKLAGSAPEGMLLIPAAEFNFAVCGVEQEGFTAAGTGIQYPWESVPRRHHRHTLDIAAFYIDRTPVTNAQFKQFIDATRYRPADDHHFLRNWVDGAPQAGWENKPVTWVSLEDVRAYCAWAGKRLPHGWEWQYAAQGTDERLYPWGNSWDPNAAPAANPGRNILPPADVDAHPRGASPFGVLDLVGNVWQWTDEFVNEHTRAAALRGGSSYQPQSSLWYFPQTYRLDRHGKYLLMAPCKDRSGCLGFRCVVDA